MKGKQGSATVLIAKATVLTFVSRGEQLRLRGQRNFSHWHRITKGLEPFGPAERKRLFQRQAEDEAKDRAWAQRHHPLQGGGIVVLFPSFTASFNPECRCLLGETVSSSCALHAAPFHANGVDVI